MKQINQTTPVRYHHTHQTYGGEIYPSDFDTESSSNPRRRESSVMASRILRDARFDEQCRRNDEIRHSTH